MKLETFIKLEYIFTIYNTEEKLLNFLYDNYLNFEDQKRIYNMFDIYKNKERWNLIKLTLSTDTIKFYNVRNLNEIINDIEKEQNKTIVIFLINKDYENIELLINYPDINIICENKVMTPKKFINMRKEINNRKIKKLFE